MGIQNIFPACKVSLPDNLRRVTKLDIANHAELFWVRYFTNLSYKNFSIDSNFYPLGSCSMKYNPKIMQNIANYISDLHPMAPEESAQAILQCLYDLGKLLENITGMAGHSLAPMAGANGEWAGIAMIRSYHLARGEGHRNIVLIPDAAHGTNPATAALCGYKVVVVPTKADGDLDLSALRTELNTNVAAVMLTNPSTLGVFEKDILTITKLAHEVGAQMYYDGANLNAIVCHVKPHAMGFDVMHINTHKTFATPHGSGGPGSGPITCAKHLVAFLPQPRVIKEGDSYKWCSDYDFSIGRMGRFYGNVGILLQALVYIKLHGERGLYEVSEVASLNANYLQTRLMQEGFAVAFPERRASHEFIVHFQQWKKQYNVSALDVAKRLLDYKIHAPTMYFPQLIAECMLIEPTETESLATLDNFVNTMVAIKQEVESNALLVKTAPHNVSVSRVDEVAAARNLDLCSCG
jgi:glycine dehydrogenase subunit 2